MGPDSLTDYRAKRRQVEVVVELRDVSKTYSIAGGDRTVQALKSVTMTSDSSVDAIRRGDFVMIRGPSGGGKTTLLNMIGTIDKTSTGEIHIFGDAVDAKSKDDYLAHLRLERIGFVFQTFNLLATMSAFENVELPMTIAGHLNAAQRKERALKLLQLVGLRDRVSHLPSELSGGEQQRVTIARALANEPDILLLDEPTGDLDTRNTIEIMDLLSDINETQGTTMIMVTHNPDVECYAQRVIYVKDGVFEKECINRSPTRLNYDDYVAWLNTQSDTHGMKYN
eukprot:TRINITY_DN7938_c0_g1_i2.p2 TRINITY_DN7938_c0_g1~~TRINITY_DN7938_c0_g1_i2.p2  ORF type:complete len:282 (+),score=64.47 TRINITY_DN7938_c0_g1_i2:233-1078(+)